MSRRIVFSLHSGKVEGELTDSPEIDELIAQLPVTAAGNVWGEEIYFELPEAIPVGKKTKNVDVGDIAYWEEGRSLCIFFGPTPVSRSSRPEPYVPVFRVGSVSTDGNSLDVLRRFEQGNTVTVDNLSHD